MGLPLFLLIMSASLRAPRAGLLYYRASRVQESLGVSLVETQQREARSVLDQYPIPDQHRVGPRWAVCHRVFLQHFERLRISARNDQLSPVAQQEQELSSNYYRGVVAFATAAAPQSLTRASIEAEELALALVRKPEQIIPTHNRRVHVHRYFSVKPNLLGLPLLCAFDHSDCHRSLVEAREDQHLLVDNRRHDVLNVFGLERNPPKLLTGFGGESGDGLLSLCDDLSGPAAPEDYRRSVAGAVAGPRPFHISGLGIESHECARVVAADVHDHETVVHNRRGRGA